MANALDENTTRRSPFSAAAIIMLNVLLTLLSKIKRPSARSGPGELFLIFWCYYISEP